MLTKNQRLFRGKTQRKLTNNEEIIKTPPWVCSFWLTIKNRSKTFKNRLWYNNLTFRSALWSLVTFMKLLQFFEFLQFCWNFKTVLMSVGRLGKCCFILMIEFKSWDNKIKSTIHQIFHQRYFLSFLSTAFQQFFNFPIQRYSNKTITIFWRCHFVLQNHIGQKFKVMPYNLCNFFSL